MKKKTTTYIINIYYLYDVLGYVFVPSSPYIHLWSCTVGVFRSGRNGLATGE